MIFKFSLILILFNFFRIIIWFSDFILHPISKVNPLSFDPKINIQSSPKVSQFFGLQFYFSFNDKLKFRNSLTLIKQNNFP